MRTHQLSKYFLVASHHPHGANPDSFFEQAGINSNASYAISLGGTGIAFCGTILSWFLISRFGRRSIFLAGFCILVAALYLIAILACVHQATAIKYVQAVLCLIWLGAYSMTAGPIVYTIVAEIGATQVRRSAPRPSSWAEAHTMSATSLAASSSHT